MLGSFNNWNIIRLKNKTILSEDIDEIKKVLRYGISDSMVALVQTGKYIVINA